MAKVKEYILAIIILLGLIIWAIFRWQMIAICLIVLIVGYIIFERGEK